MIYFRPEIFASSRNLPLPQIPISSFRTDVLFIPSSTLTRSAIFLPFFPSILVALSFFYYRRLSSWAPSNDPVPNSGPRPSPRKAVFFSLTPWFLFSFRYSSSFHMSFYSLLKSFPPLFRYVTLVQFSISPLDSRFVRVSS